VRLNDFDQITVGDATYIFRQPLEITEEYQATVREETIRQFATVPCGLLVAAPSVAEAIKGLNELQAQRNPAFRIALHVGPVAIGGMESIGEESLMGPDVNFVFRMEKLARSLGLSFLASLAAAAEARSRPENKASRLP
jgi:class 3 adenylate cyclase